MLWKDHDLMPWNCSTVLPFARTSGQILLVTAASAFRVMLSHCIKNLLAVMQPVTLSDPRGIDRK
jgi:hypothetical protein